MVKSITQDDLKKRRQRGAVVKRKVTTQADKPVQAKPKPVIDPAMMLAAKAAVESAEASMSAAMANKEGLSALMVALKSFNTKREPCRLVVQRNDLGLIEYIDVEPRGRS